MGLKENAYVYEEGIALLRKSRANSVRRLLHAAWAVARFSWLNHPGRFADGAVENPLFEIGQKIQEDPRLRDWASALEIPAASGNLHVATHLKDMGGHSRVIGKWVNGDDSATHTIVLTEQQRELPAFLKETFRRRGARVVLLPASASTVVKAGMLRAMARLHTRVILHHNPSDVIPVIAFAAKGGPPVAMFNHAHFSFSLGATVSDVVINTMNYFSDVTRKYRFPPAALVLALSPGMSGIPDKDIDKGRAKMALGLSANTPVVMAIGQERYFAPSLGYDFFRTLGTLLERQGQLHAFIIGVGEESRLIPERFRGHPRAHFRGPTPDPNVFYEASDVCLESFPTPSIGGLAEAVAFGEAFPIPVYGSSENILRVPQRPILEYEYRAATEDTYVDYVSGVIRQRERFREKANRLRLGLAELDSRWPDRLRTLQRQVDSLQHSPHSIPIAMLDNSEDSRLLADRSDICVGKELDRLFSPAASVAAHWRAARCGMESRVNALEHLCGRALGRARSIIGGRH